MALSDHTQDQSPKTPTPVRTSPLMPLLDPNDDQLLPYAIEQLDTDDDASAPSLAPIPVLSHLAPPAIEYASLRTACVLFDQTHRAVISVTGDDRVAFLSSMLTQELKDIADDDKPNTPNARSSFWLSRMGRIQTDLRVVAIGKTIMMMCDAHDAAVCVTSLDTFLFAEDVAINDVSNDWHCFSLHGPAACELLCQLIDDVDNASLVRALTQDHAIEIVKDTARIIVDRCDTAGVPGFSLTMQQSHARSIAEKLLTLGNWDRHAEFGKEDAAIEKLCSQQENQQENQRKDAKKRLNIRPIGWYAMNTARIEAGTPMFHFDFGTKSLPHETGVFHDRVSLTKGCYLGQEIVARLEARGKAKQIVRALKPIPTNSGTNTVPIPHDAHGCALLPMDGTPVFELDAHDELRALAQGDAETNPAHTPAHIGTISSSTISPMLGSMPIALASIKWKHATPGSILLTIAEGELLAMEVQDQLRFV